MCVRVPVLGCLCFEWWKHACVGGGLGICGVRMLRVL